MLSRITDSLSFGDARDRKYRDQWQSTHGYSERPLIPKYNNSHRTDLIKYGGNRSKKRGKTKIKSLRQKR